MSVPVFEQFPYRLALVYPNPHPQTSESPMLSREICPKRKLLYDLLAEPDGKVPIPTWFQAIQWVYVAAIVLMGIAAIWLISQFNCPCQRGKHKQHLAAGILLMLACKAKQNLVKD